MKTEILTQLRQALLDNAAGHPLASVHRNRLFTLLDEAEQFNAMVDAAVDAIPMDIEPQLPSIKPIKVEG